MKEKKTWSQDIVVAIFLLAASSFLLVNALTTMSAEARQFPVVILAIFIGLSIAMLIMGIKDTRDAAAGKDVKISNIKFEEVKYPLLIFVVVVLYVIAVDIIGFIIPSLVFTAGVMWFNYERKPLVLIGVPVGLVAFLYVLFTFILKTKLP